MDYLLHELKLFIINGNHLERKVITTDFGSVSVILYNNNNIKLLCFYMISIKKKYRNKGLGTQIIKQSISWVDEELIDGRISLNVMSNTIEKILSKYKLIQIHKFPGIELLYPSYLYSRTLENNILMEFNEF